MYKIVSKNKYNTEINIEITINNNLQTINYLFLDYGYNVPDK